jgi:hypothetical protein
VNRRSLMRMAPAAAVASVLPSTLVAAPAIPAAPAGIPAALVDMLDRSSGDDNGVWVARGDEWAWLDFEYGRITFETRRGHDDLVCIGYSVEEEA